MKTHAGFTLIEVLIAVVILAGGLLGSATRRLTIVRNILLTELTGYVEMVKISRDKLGNDISYHSYLSSKVRIVSNGNLDFCFDRAKRPIEIGVSGCARFLKGIG